MSLQRSQKGQGWVERVVNCFHSGKGRVKCDMSCSVYEVGVGGGEEGGGGYVPLASQSPCPIIIYFVASYRPHLSHFWENVIFAIPTKSLSIYASTLSIL